MNIKDYAISARRASYSLSALDSNTKNKALECIAEKLQKNTQKIVEANKRDVKRSEEENLASPLLKRLKFDSKKINNCIEGINSLVSLPDPVGKTLMATELDDELELYKVSCPIGVIGVIFESRPDALVQISTLCLKSGNCVLLKGGSEAKETNRVLFDIIYTASIDAGLPEGWMALLETRSEVNEMLSQDEYIDLVIPRGSNDFVRYIMDNSRIPVLGHADGICHCYVDSDAEIEKAVRIATDSKTQYTAVCNALETLLVHKDIAKDFLPLFKEEMDRKNVQLYGCPETCEVIDIQKVSNDDWSTEYLDLQLSIKIVDNIDEAVEHINYYGSGHTDVIVSKSKIHIEKFMELIDSGNVFANCSTRFSDGFRYGFGAEVGISTNKIHARGPVGLEGLMIYKYKLYGDGHIVADYVSGQNSFKHNKMV